ncbi:MAG: imidazoleglycerol-phosphate dehydratase HisB [Clostridia bacterium]|nr:imidazoleglycerol-phosphate dehydratase HisB [Clostridia bacterium]
MRYYEMTRYTKETNILLTIDLDGKGESTIDTDCAFLNHMLTLFAKHARFDITLKCRGDSDVDYHHTVEDIGICLGKALKEILKDKRGIMRYGSTILPMDEVLILSAVDLSGRSYLGYDVSFTSYTVGNFDAELGKEFFLALTRNGEFTLHIRQLAGENTHHILEGIFKSVARSLAAAVKIDTEHPDDIPSTKGTL